MQQNQAKIDHGRHFSGLNPQQKRAVQAPQKPLLIVAGAGTGKTTTLTNRLTHLIEQGVPPGSICAITFTNKAAKEMESRVTAASGQQSAARNQLGAGSWKLGRPYIGTFHALGARILRKEGRALGRTPNFAIFDDQDSLRLMKRILKGMDAVRAADKPSFFLSKVGAIKNSAVTLDELASSSYGPDRRAVLAYHRYEEELQKNNAFDFDDLIEKVGVLFRGHPAVLQKYRGQFTHLLVDEYQDINPTQYDLIRLLAGDSNQVSVVGDDHQMIYGWRFANLDIFLNFERDWPGAQVMLLEENYRSSSTIIEAASAVIANNRRQKPKQLRTANPAGGVITVFEAPTEEDEAMWIGDRISDIRRRISDNQNLRSGIRDLESESTAVLYRTNAQSRAIEQELVEHEIPYKIFGGVKFYERREVKDVLAALRYASNPQDSVSFERLETALGKRRAADVRTDLQTSNELAPVKVIERFLARTSYLDYLDRTFLNATERRENITELIHFAARFETLPEFLEQVSLVQSTDDDQVSSQLPATSGQQPAAGSQQPVTLMTIHMAKGLEFDTVFVAGCSEGLLPHTRSLDAADQLEEERRLMYVAMTRARHTLFLSFYNIPSRFLFEIPQKLTNFESGTSDTSVLEDDEERYITLD